MVFIWGYSFLIMILSTHGFIASSIGQIDADALAFFNRVTTAGGSLSATEQTAILTLVSDLKSYGIWTKMKAIYPMVGASAPSCAQNLKSSSFTGTFTATGWTFASTGVTPNGTSAYMTTGIVPSTEFDTINDGNFGYYHRTILKSNSTCLGANSGGYYIADWINGSSSSYPSINDGNSVILSYGTNVLGFRQVSRNSSSVNEILYKLNTTNYTITQSASGRPTNQIYIGASSPGLFYSDSQIAFAYVGDGQLSTTNQSDFYTAVQAFQTTLSRQV